MQPLSERGYTVSQKWDRHAGKYEPVAHLLPGFELSRPRLTYTSDDQLYVRDATLRKVIPVQRCRLHSVAVAWVDEQRRLQVEKVREEVRKSKHGGGAKRSGDNSIAGGVRSGGSERQSFDTNGDCKRRRHGSRAGSGGVGNGMGE